MPLPAALIPAAGWAATKLGGAFAAAKGLLGASGVAKAAGGLGTRMAGGKLAGLGTKMLGGLKAAIPHTMDDAALMIGPDVLFGGLAGAMTPGDLGDKLIAGASTGIGGAVGGIGVRGALGGIAPKMMATKPYMQMGAELVGGMGGDIAAQGVADNILRAKGGGTTPYEKMAADQQKQLENEILQQYLSGKGGYPMGNGVG